MPRSSFASLNKHRHDDALMRSGMRSVRRGALARRVGRPSLRRVVTQARFGLRAPRFEPLLGGQQAARMPSCTVTEGCAAFARDRAEAWRVKSALAAPPTRG